MCECIFCKIVKKEIPSYTVDENDLAIAFLDINPTSIAHTIVIPKKHFLNLTECNQDDLNGVISLVKKVSKKLLDSKELNIKGFNFLSNQNKIAGQEIDHFHFHVIPRYDVKDNIKISFNKREIDLDKIYRIIKNN